MRKYDLLRKAVILSWGMLAVITPVNDQQPSQPSQEGDVFRKVSEAQDELQRQLRQQIRIQPGTEGQAKDYYGRISRADVLNFRFEGSTLDSLLEYMGYTGSNGATPATYSGLAAKDIEKLPSFELMPVDNREFAILKSRVSDPDAFDKLLDLDDFLDGKVLVSRFFAPKIATYYDSKKPVPTN